MNSCFRGHVWYSTSDSASYSADPSSQLGDFCIPALGGSSRFWRRIIFYRSLFVRSKHSLQRELPKNRGIQQQPILSFRPTHRLRLYPTKHVFPWYHLLDILHRRCRKWARRVLVTEHREHEPPVRPHVDTSWTDRPSHVFPDLQYRLFRRGSYPVFRFRLYPPVSHPKLRVSNRSAMCGRQLPIEAYSSLVGQCKTEVDEAV